MHKAGGSIEIKHTGLAAIENALNNRRTRIIIARNGVKIANRATNDNRKPCFIDVDSINVFDCHLPGVIKKSVRLLCLYGR